MGINIYVANNQASQLMACANRLIQARNDLHSYKSSINFNWNSNEMVHINNAIDAAIERINYAINSLNSLSEDVRNTAAQIKREEDAAAVRAKRAADRKAARNAAQTNLSNAQTLADENKKLLDEAIKAAKKAPTSKNVSALQKAQSVYDEAIKEVEKMQTIYNNLPR